MYLPCHQQALKEFLQEKKRTIGAKGRKCMHKNTYRYSSMLPNDRFFGLQSTN